MLHDLRGQGCSDAGFCTISSLKDNHSSDADSSYKNRFEAGISFGEGDNNISITNPHVEYTRAFNKLSVTTKILFLAASGELATQKGFSDIFITPAYAFSGSLKITLGLKIPLSDGNNKAGTLPLPMGYQTSLGTTDLIAGVNYRWDQIGLMVAIQQPLTQNKNEFLTENYSMNPGAFRYQSTNKYRRSGDALLRGVYSFNLPDGRFKITPGLLFIYHIANDTFIEETGERVTIEGSSGLTLNGTLSVEYKLNKKKIIEFNAGTPFVVRETRPDGLTRKYVVSVEFKTLF